MALTREELKNAHNNVMTVMENHIMSMVGCDRKTANLIANEVLELDRDVEQLLDDRYVIGKDFNTKDWWVYDNETDWYICRCDTEAEAKEYVKKKLYSPTMTRQEMMDYLGIVEETDKSIVDTAMSLQNRYDLNEYGLSTDGYFDNMQSALEDLKIGEKLFEVMRINGIVVYKKPN